MIKALSIIDHFNQQRCIPAEDITWMISNKRVICDYFVSYRNRDFAIALLAAIVDLRQSPESEIYIEDIMFACLLLTLHKHVEDCLLIWAAKNTDFDTYYGVDIQLVPFTGVSATITYLKDSDDPEAIKALEYIGECNDGDEFEDLESYYSNVFLYWWLASCSGN